MSSHYEILRRLSQRTAPKPCFYPNFKIYSTDKFNGKEVSHVKFEKMNLSRVITLNRPEALNSLTLEMIRVISPQLQVYEQSDITRSIILRGEQNPKVASFCAGGDVVALVKEKDNPNSTLTADFFAEEYALNHYIATLKTPFIAIMDGVTMGGGVGLSVHSKFKIATERTVFALPETSIGLFPDVGSTFLLPRLNDHLGMYLGLTGARLRGCDVYMSGLATHYVPSYRIESLIERISFMEANDSVTINACLDEFSEKITPFSLQKYMPIISRCFSAPSVPRIIDRLKMEGSSDADHTKFVNNTLETLLSVSPTSLEVTHRLITRGKNLSFKQCLELEYIASQNMVKSHDFISGVTAKLINKNQTPVWNPSSIAATQKNLSAIDYILTKNTTNSPLFFNEKDFHDYPTNFGLPKQKEIKAIIDKQNFHSKEDALEHILRVFSKPGVYEYAKEILDRNLVYKDDKVRWEVDLD